tara:strand:+ start:210 stop:587 length:378 start_codon:yes stop_codon:yes gene_type:complete
MNIQALKIFANLMRTPAPDPNDPVKIYKILQHDISKSTENEFMRFASMLLQDNPNDAIPHLRNILTLPTSELQMFSTQYDSIDYEKICTSIIRDLKRETLPASRRVSKKIHLVLGIYCWKYDIIL